MTDASTLTPEQMAQVAEFYRALERAGLLAPAGEPLLHALERIADARECATLLAVHNEQMRLGNPQGLEYLWARIGELTTLMLRRPARVEVTAPDGSRQVVEATIADD